jgi:hypothetical protein
MSGEGGVGKFKAVKAAIRLQKDCIALMAPLDG